MLNQGKHSWLLPVIVVTALAILILDSQTPLGYADYILYFIPVSLTILHQRPKFPLHIASFVTFLTLLGFILSGSDGMSLFMATVNRGYASAVFWIIALMVRQIIINRNKAQISNWARDLQVRVATVVRGDLSPAKICENLFRILAEELNLKVAAAYIVTENHKSLEFVHGHAFAPEERNKIISIGSNLLGQCVHEKKLLNLSRPGEDYLKISSALGESPSPHLIFLPLLADDSPIAAVELAFESKITIEQKQLLSDLSEMLGMALRSATQKLRLASLLKESQQLALKLQTQQEELKVSNEELEQQGKALKESHLKMENQQAELEQSNQQLEEQTQLLENQKQILDEKNRELEDARHTLEEKAKDLAQASHYKSEFLANMSHELRTPLNSTLILARLLADNKSGNLTPEQIKYAEVIHTSGNDLLNLINDILDLSKVEAGKMIVNPEQVKISNVIDSLKAVFTPMAEEKELKLKVEMDKDLPDTFITDRQRLEQILRNFLSNALKFTEKGHVSLQVHKDPKGINFRVKDSGIGIKPEQQEMIFQAFRQADGTTNRRFGGTGLGLSISREFATLLGGEISVKSSLGQGSTFTLTLPVEFTVHPMPKNERASKSSHSIETTPLPAPAFPTEVPQRSSLDFEDDRLTLTKSSRKILIVEDDPAFARILFNLAKDLKYSVMVASTAEEGLALAHKYSPHAILLDVRLPDHSGMLVLDQLKADPATRHIPVHVLSSNDFSKPALEMGAVGFMLKPVKYEQLEVAFSNLNSMMSHKNKRVLIVEDDEVQREYITNLISDSLVKVESVTNASDALEKLLTTPYDCMIMDLSLPDMQGHDLLSKMSSQESKYSYPPVIIYTARDLTREEENKLRQYSKSIIIKGAKSPERLLSEVTLFLHKIETELPQERQKMLQELRGRDQSLNGRKILVVDDDVRNIYALTSALENHGAVIEVARNGVEAVDKVFKESDIDLVLMDIMMPVMNGYEAMRKIRANKNYTKLPIITLTAKAMKDDHMKSLEAGANDYMAKPVDTDKLLSLIRVWLPSQRGYVN